MSSNGKTTTRNGKKNWESEPRWKGITRPYTWADVESLRGSMKIEHSLARHGAETLWSLLQAEPYVAALGAMTAVSVFSKVTLGTRKVQRNSVTPGYTEDS